MIGGLLTSLRPKQWTKNLLVFAGYLFTIQQEHSIGTLLAVVAAFGLFCAIAGAGYVVNDVMDVERDCRHPSKCKRPIASNAVPVPAALIFAAIVLTCSLFAAYRLDILFCVLLLGYFLLSLSYSAFLKHIVVLDLLAIAAGFVARAVAGAMVIHVEISPWLLACTTLLALFLGIAKRRSEIVTLEDDGILHRATLGHYTAPMLDQMLSISASAALMTYFLYTFTPGSRTGATHPFVMLTVPFVIYGIFRYLYLIHSRNAGGSPEQVLLEDKPLLINVILYVIVAIVAMKLKT